MHHHRYRHLILLLVSLTATGLACKCVHPEMGAKAMVASPHPLASQIGVEILQAGGNAIDAAVAIGLALGVVDQFNSGLGGGAYLVIRMADGRVAAIDGREVAPAAAHTRTYFRDGAYAAGLSRTGLLASGVPGALAAYEMARAQFGALPLAALLEPAQRVARAGFVIDPYYAKRLASVAQELARDPASPHYFHPDGSPLGVGDRLVQPALASAYAGIAHHGTAHFYQGPIADALVTRMQHEGGLMTHADLATYRPLVRAPVKGRLRGHTILSMPPSSSGGIHVIQILGILDRLGTEGADDWAQAMGFAFFDRHRYLGDPDFVQVPSAGLVSPPYLERLATKIRAGMRPPHTENAFAYQEANHTAGFVVIDAAGNAVAATATINTTFGAKRTIPGTGIMLNNEMDDFVTNPEGKNAYGLTGTAANDVAAGKRPLSSMSPTLIVDAQGRVRMAVAAAGGPMIITSVAQTIWHVIVRHADVTSAVAAPRMHHQWMPPQVYLEADYPLWGRVQLSGQQLHMEPPPWQAKVQAIVRDPNTGTLSGASDPRAAGAVAGNP